MKQLIYLRDVVTLSVDPEKCSGCGLCLDVCPRSVLGWTDTKVGIMARDLCMQCGACARNCPTGAVTVESGVGCAALVIRTTYGRGKSSCCGTVASDDRQSCDMDETPPPCCDA